MKIRTTVLLSALCALTLCAFPVMAQVSSNEAAPSVRAQQAAPPDFLNEDSLEHPLRPPDTSSPRATFTSFIKSLNQVYRLIMAADEANMRLPGLMTPSTLLKVEGTAEILLERAVYCLNLSEAPEALQQDMGWEAAFELKEILDRMKLPPLDSIPDLQAVIAARQKDKNSPIERWRVPDTDIVIALVKEGPRQGEYLFSPGTVKRTRDFYAKVQLFPYREDALVSPGFLDFYSSTPGRLLPPKWSHWLPKWATVMYLSQTLWQWLALFFFTFAGIGISIFLYRWWRKRTSGYAILKRSWGRFALVLLEAVMATLIIFLIDEKINITGDVLIAAHKVFETLYWFFMAWAALLAGNALAETIIASPRIDPEGIHASLIKTAGILIGFLCAAGIFFQGLAKLGVSIIPLLTGLGVGGLAIALAARPTLENLIGGIMILLDRPYRVGQRVKVQGHDGIVENIGFRSTKLRLLTGHQTTVPNEVMARMDIENVARRPFIKRISNITITYNTPVEKVKKAVEIIKEILDDHEGMLKNYPPRVYFNEFNAESLNISMIYWYHPPNYWEFSAFNQEVNLRIMEEFEKEGIEFAFPTTTTYLTQEQGEEIKIRINSEQPAG